MESHQEAATWLFVFGVEGRDWTRTACPSIVATLSGQPVDNVYMPGLLFRFPAVTNAARAALRCHDEISRALSSDVPPIIVDHSGNSKPLGVIAATLTHRTIALTPMASRYLVSEPVDMMPGPSIPMEDGSALQTHVLGATSHNLGWALPALQLGGRGPATGSAEGKQVPAPVILKATPESKYPSLPKLPWGWIMMITVSLIGLMGATLVTKAIFSSLRGPQQITSPANPDEATEIAKKSPLLQRLGKMLFPSLDEVRQNPNEAGESDLEPIILSEPQETTTITPSTQVKLEPIEPGFGTVVIQATPGSAWVYLDGEFVGKKSPIVLPKKSNQKTYQLTIKKAGYQPYMSLFNVQAEERKVISIALQKNPTSKP